MKKLSYIAKCTSRWHLADFDSRHENIEVIVESGTNCGPEDQTSTSSGFVFADLTQANNRILLPAAFPFAVRLAQTLLARPSRFSAALASALSSSVFRFASFLSAAFEKSSSSVRLTRRMRSGQRRTVQRIYPTVTSAVRAAAALPRYSPRLRTDYDRRLCPCRHHRHCRCCCRH